MELSPLLQEDETQATSPEECSTLSVITSIRFQSTVNLFKVNVPVLSLQRASMHAISSMAIILLVIVSC
ncbi:unnamed protein product, partial [Vitis vinifera]|uniref:Uncharacterized protein n=1 Tax=Vitis vinifera TaxID=29760 RepID=D7SND8_VITVI